MLAPLKTADTARAGEWDRAADCYVAPGQNVFGRQSFTIGIFRWEPRKAGGMKRGIVRQRVKGYPSRAQEALDEANRRVAELNSARNFTG